jgi:kanamycin kinase
MTINLDDYPAEFHPLLSGAKLYDRSYSPGARANFIDKAGGYFLKSAPKGSLEREAVMTRFFHRKGLSAAVLSYISDERDWMLTEKIPGDDCIAAKYLEQPERLCDITAELLAAFHAVDYSGCSVQNHTERYLAGARKNYFADTIDKTNYPDKDGADTMLKEYCKDFGYTSAKEAWAVVEQHGHLLKSDTLLHGDYCLPMSTKFYILIPTEQSRSNPFT